MRLVFLSLVLMGATCNGTEAPQPQPPSLADEPPPDELPELIAAPDPEEAGTADEVEEAPKDETDNGAHDTGKTAGELEQRLDHQLDEADNVLRVLRQTSK